MTDLYSRLKSAWPLRAAAAAFRLQTGKGGRIACPVCAAGFLNETKNGQGARCDGCKRSFDVFGLLGRALQLTDSEVRAELTRRTPKVAPDENTGDLFS